MPAPTNISAATAIDIGTIPATYVQDVNFGGLNYTTWYKFTTSAAEVKVLGAWAFSGNIGTGYRPTIRVYSGPTAAPVSILNINAFNKPIQFPVNSSTEYFIEVTKNVDTSPAIVTLSIVLAPLNPVADGNIIVNDDGISTAGFPLAIMSHLVDHTAINYFKGIAEGEAGDILNNRIMAFDNFAADTVVIYGPSFNVISTLSMAPGANQARIRACRGGNKFYAAHLGAPPEVKTITALGAFGPITWILTGIPTNLSAIAASNNETILYFTRNVAGAAVERWNLTVSGALSDLGAGIAGYFVVDILVLSNNDIIVLFDNNSTLDIIVKRYNPAGTILNTYAVGTNVHPNNALARLAYALDDPNSFWVWNHPVLGISRFLNIKLSDGSILTTRNQTSYTSGAYDGAETATPTGRLGNSTSCPFMIMTPLTFNTSSGIYKMVPGQRLDTLLGTVGTTNVKIPNPFIKTGMFGE